MEETASYLTSNSKCFPFDIRSRVLDLHLSEKEQTLVVIESKEYSLSIWSNILEAFQSS